ncbi:RluA family pseudouridine synthase [Lentilactobacillus diolivorans]|uniref:RluA family pseudouridine synthase n=1 Tax=Lentilactobacillus diolivorans TaxID=179838 RepID=UPI0024691424|nr:RluA family pseudouridine synthase [Lentilactobacillus diolivorans]MDH5105469.1 RluA family pseudouridine synthase [Lentilactobacillus diolivorans]
MKFTWQKTATEPKTLKKFLNGHGISHRMYKTLKTDGRFNINGQPATSEVIIQTGDQVEVVLPDEKSDPQVVVSDQPINVVFEDENWLVVNKPAGLTVVPGPANREDTLVNRIKGHLIQEGAKNLVPHIITRLDRFTSGLVLVAKHRLANSLANEMLAGKQLHKRYQAVVSGIGLPSHGHIEKAIAKDPDGFGQLISQDGKPADTEYWVLKEMIDRTLVDVVLHTGRTHQIRVHFAAIGHPLLGDQLYHGPMNRGIDRQALHATMLDFADPFSRKSMRFKSPLAKDITQLID